MTRVGNGTSRRRFLQYTALTAGGLLLPQRHPWPKRRTIGPDEPMKLGVIGVGGRGTSNLGGVANQNIVALCDVDQRSLASAAEKFPGAVKYADFRDLIGAGGLDGVVISTPDHTHAPAAAMALRAGCDVYCEKPLAHTVHEVRVLTELAREHGAVTQLGTQIHSLPNYRRVVEVVQSGAIGPVAEAHVFVNGTNWSGGERPAKGEPVPDHLDWDLWLGPAPHREYAPNIYHPAHWRRWWDFGGGTMADMACHFTDLAFWTLGLRYPTSVRAEPGPIHPETTPGGMTVHYVFPERGDQPELDLTWYDGRNRPPILERLGLGKWTNGVLFIGRDGWLIADYTRRQLGPAKTFAGYAEPEPWIPDSIGHHAEWIEACRSRGPTTCTFDYSGPLTEAVLLGLVSYLAGGEELAWDAEKMKVVNLDEANEFLRRDYRQGWAL